MAHCNDKTCTKSTRYDGLLRLCECPCATCGSTSAEKKRHFERGTCESCGARVGTDDEFCEGCGEAVTDRAREGAFARSNDEMFERNQQLSSTAAKVGKASRMIGLLAVLFALSGTIMWLLTRDQARIALMRLSSLAADERVTVEGKEYTVAALRRQLEGEPTQVLVVNLVLAAIMLALYVWSRRSPLPAIATALAVFIGVNFISFLVEPVSLFQGIIVKALAIAALTVGLRHALAARRIEGQTAE